MSQASSYDDLKKLALAVSDPTSPEYGKHKSRDEVRTLLALGLDPALPAMRAHGVPELAAHLRGELSLQEAARRIELVTGQYTKRQATWFRHHPLAGPTGTHTIRARIASEVKLLERKYPDMLAFIESLG